MKSSSDCIFRVLMLHYQQEKGSHVLTVVLLQLSYSKRGRRSMTAVTGPRRYQPQAGETPAALPLHAQAGGAADGIAVAEILQRGFGGDFAIERDALVVPAVGTAEGEAGPNGIALVFEAGAGDIDGGTIQQFAVDGISFRPL